MPILASNRIGTEVFEGSEITFYGGSFVLGGKGEVVAQVGAREGWPEEGGGVADPAPAKEEGFVTASFDLDELQADRAG